MDLTQQETEVLDQYAEKIRQGPARLGPTPYATVIVCCSSVLGGKPGRENIIRRLFGFDSELRPEADGFDGEPVSKGFKVHGAILGLELDWMSIEGRPDYPTIEMANHADAFIIVYDDASRESFESIIRFNDMVSSLPVMAVSQSPKSSREKSSGINPDTQPKSAWRRLLGSWRQSSSKKRADMTTSHSVPQQGTGPDMNAGPIPKIIICNHSAEKLNVVSREGGVELAKRLRTPFYMISTQIPGWGDRDILERLIPRLMYRRACGEEKARAMGGKLRSSFTAWSRFNSSM